MHQWPPILARTLTQWPAMQRANGQVVFTVEAITCEDICVRSCKPYAVVVNATSAAVVGGRLPPILDAMIRAHRK